MADFKQATRRMGVKTPLGKDVLLLVSFSGQEELSQLYSYELDLRSDKESIDPKEIVGKRVTFWVDFVDGQHRFFDGFVQRFSYRGKGDRLHIYKAHVVPWAWFLTQNSNCRIFQDKKTTEIIAQVFEDHGFSDFENKTDGTYEPRTYCVQYRETDYNFVARLMEEDGIFFYFKHEDGKHTLVMCDSQTAYYDCQDKEVQFHSVLSEPDLTDQISRWEHQYEYRAGKWLQRDYNFEDPSQNLETEKSTIVQLEKNKSYSHYDYPGLYGKQAHGSEIAEKRMEEVEAAYNVVHGESHCRSFSPGGKFTMKKHHVKGEENKGYVVTSVRHVGTVGSTYVVGMGDDGGSYGNSFSCIPDGVVYRPPRVSPKPTIQGLQTAVVVGPPGQEIYTDEYGRVKVQFHWDREGNKDEKSSCWVRCAQSMAGKQWGAMYIPRIGQEVVVVYEEGDPDRPLITGVVYNANQMPAYTLPDEKTKSYLKTNSSQGGDGYNEIRFEDKAGEEQIFVHAQRNMDMRVQEDTMQTFRGNRHEIVGDKQQGNLHELVHGDKHTLVKGQQVQKVAGDCQLTIGKGGGSGGNLHVNTEKELVELVGTDRHSKVKGNRNEEVVGQYSFKARERQEKLDMGVAIEAGQNVYIKAGMNLVLEAGLKLSLVVGSNFVDISPMGVAVNGTTVLINSGGGPGAGTPPQPTAPKEAAEAAPVEPEEADDSETGQKSAD